MTARVQHSYLSSGEVEQVVAVLSGPGWAQCRARALHDDSRVVERVERPDGGVTLVVSRELPQGAPGFLERFLPRDGRVVQTDEWGPAVAGSRHGTWKVEIPGAPARLGGTMRLEPASGGSRYTLEGEVKVSLPLIGGRAETFIAGLVDKLVAKEGAVLQDALNGQS